MTMTRRWWDYDTTMTSTWWDNGDDDDTDHYSTATTTMTRERQEDDTMMMATWQWLDNNTMMMMTRQRRDDNDDETMPQLRWCDDDNDDETMTRRGWHNDNNDGTMTRWSITAPEDEDNWCIRIVFLLSNHKESSSLSIVCKEKFFLPRSNVGQSTSKSMPRALAARCTTEERTFFSRRTGTGEASKCLRKGNVPSTSKLRFFFSPYKRGWGSGKNRTFITQ